MERRGAGNIPLTTFQPLHRVAQLARDGVLLGSWDHVPGGWEAGYATMTAAMSRSGIECEGRPPMWAWAGPVTWGTAFGLIGDDVSDGWAALRFRAPAGLVLLSEYDSWCDELTAGGLAPVRPPVFDPTRILQATLPRIESAWVTGVEPLPTHGIYELDWDTPT